MQSPASDKADVIAIPPLVFLTGFAVGLLIHLVVPIHLLPQSLEKWVGGALILASIPLVISAVRALGRAKTTLDVRKPTTAIATDGAYKISRNPSYLSLSLLYFGLASVINSLWIFLLFIPVVLVIESGVVRPEEAYLERKFGEEYLVYKTRVRRWI